MKLEGKIALVTGAAQGMGRAIVRHFAEQGATVYAVDINVDALEETVAGLAERGVVQHCNVADEHSVCAAFERIAVESGRLDILVNNAGIGSHDTFLDTPLEHWNRVLGVNLTGAFLCSREAARLMSRAGSGAIVNLASTAAITGEGPSHYCASKAAIMGLTRSTARELAASGIRVNTLVPGPTDTPMMAGIPAEWMESMVKAIPLGRLCQPEEIARVAAFLAGDDASFITGQNIAVNGGMSFI
ncbi:SDR family NAD(P)-dependent oxidoreductase [Pseudomonas flexibilis]|uniref:3-oxoacyl-ACP reductase n=1 Tax=Pseudomonas flexibilis TaxID=706570 RepID=A0A0B3BU95_9PSED|nr:3-oxoacyl-ACP reductase family protein [Pseudomonas flexibilis]KHO64244.1 3-oxoacyl-ACP reductase [Pseudomonas flexibilis]SCY13679.1 3-oxoacyl-[acyl-carrier protein] reductase [Pseudomonas flexibilis]